MRLPCDVLDCAGEVLVCLPAVPRQVFRIDDPHFDGDRTFVIDRVKHFEERSEIDFAFTDCDRLLADVILPDLTGRKTAMMMMESGRCGFVLEPGLVAMIRLKPDVGADP